MDARAKEYLDRFVKHPPEVVLRALAEQVVVAQAKSCAGSQVTVAAVLAVRADVIADGGSEGDETILRRAKADADGPRQLPGPADVPSAKGERPRGVVRLCRGVKASLTRLVRWSAGRSAAGTETGANLPEPAVRGRRWIKERELLTALVCRPSRLDTVAEALPPDRVETPEFRRLYEAILANPSRRDGDIESIVLRMEDAELSSLAVAMFERGEAVSACRDPADTGPGPIARMLDDALAVLKQLDGEDELATRSRAARGGGNSLGAYQEARLKRPIVAEAQAARQAQADAGSPK